MVSYHPNHQVFFNIPTRKLFTVEKSFILDYWGLSYKGLYSTLSNIDSRDNIKVYVDTFPGQSNALIYDYASDYILVNNPANADYYLTNYRGKTKYDNWEETYILTVEDIPISGIYKIR